MSTSKKGSTSFEGKTQTPFPEPLALKPARRYAPLVVARKGDDHSYLKEMPLCLPIPR